MIDSLLMAVHAFVNRVSMSFSVDETLLPRSLKQAEVYFTNAFIKNVLFLFLFFFCFFLINLFIFLMRIGLFLLFSFSSWSESEWNN